METLPMKIETENQNWELPSIIPNTSMAPITPISSCTPQMEITQSVRIGSGTSGRKLEMSQSILILGKEELIKLGTIPDFYLLDELKTRGWEINEKELIAPTYTIEQVALLVYTTLKQTKMYLHRFIDLIIKTSIEVETLHKDAAQILGITPRVMCYQLKRLKNPQTTQPLMSSLYK
jgi:hypothetical protein